MVIIFKKKEKGKKEKKGFVGVLVNNKPKFNSDQLSFSCCLLHGC